MPATATLQIEGTCGPFSGVVLALPEERAPYACAVQQRFYGTISTVTVSSPRVAPEGLIATARSTRLPACWKV